MLMGTFCIYFRLSIRFRIKNIILLLQMIGIGKLLVGVCMVLLFSCQTEKEFYVSTSFHEPADEGLRFIYSKDGIHWTEPEICIGPRETKKGWEDDLNRPAVLPEHG